MRHLDGSRRRQTSRRIIWLAAADARGHLVRAHVMRQRLAECGIDVHVFTTSQTGVDVLDQFGTPAALLESDDRVEFDERQNLDVSGTARRILRYLADPDQFLEDFARLRTAGQHAVCVVNDFHPALLIGGFLGSADMPIVHLHGSNLWRAIARPFRRPVGSLVNPLYERLLRRLRHAGRARVVHKPLADFEATWSDDDQVELPPLVPAAGGSGRHDAAADSSGGATIATYLNPHFRDPTIARSIERLAERVDADLYAVGEGFADRDGWQGCDPDFAARAATADLLISAPGMGTVGMSRTYGTPCLMMLTDQPEQRRNARRMLAASDVPPCDAVEVESPRLYKAMVNMAEPLLAADSPPARNRVDEVHGAWTDAFDQLVRRLESGDVRSAA